MKEEEIKDLQMTYRTVCDENKVFCKRIDVLKSQKNDCIKELNSIGNDKNKLIEINKNLEKENKENILHSTELQESLSKQSVKIHQYLIKLNETNQIVYYIIFIILYNR